MNQAVSKAQEIKAQPKEASPMDLQYHMEGLKPAINNLLHMYLPKNVTIEQAETLALVINDIIWYPEKYLNPMAKPPQGI
jgi:hypothetical protein